MAKDNDRHGRGFEVFKLLWDLPHGNEGRAFDPANPVLVGLANIDEGQRRASVYQTLYFYSRNLQREGH